ncbi:MAG: DUF177 domain-containing protein [Microbacteriaceae bacterium]|nr:DUF177 domain-containing protein [Microbacteriaceae bacterium]
MSEDLKVAVHDLMHKPGTMREKVFEHTVLERLGNYAIGVEAGEVLEIDLRLESVHEGILATGEVFGRTSGECGRCLDPIESDVEVDFQELFAYSGTSEDEFLVENEQIDLDQIIRDAVVLSLPLQPVCQQDCKGLCVTCGAKLADDPQHAHDAAIDPRWIGLKQLKED